MPLLRRADAPTILDEADLVPYRWSHTVQYFKAALGLRLLREQILGPARFDAAFRRYIALWAYRHPSPSDFFRTMDSEGGEDLSWFWRGWFANNWPLDLGVTAIGANGTTVTLVSKGGLVMPAILQVSYADGGSRRVRIPAEIWQQGPEATVSVAGPARIVGAVIDPDHLLPDIDRSNNTLNRPIQPVSSATAPGPAPAPPSTGH